MKEKLEELKLETPKSGVYRFFGNTAYSGVLRELLNDAPDGTDIPFMVYVYNRALDEAMKLNDQN